MNNQIKKRIELLHPYLNEKIKRLYLAAEAICLGYGGATLISKLTGVSRTTITQGTKEISISEKNQRKERIRSEGGGRKKIVEKNPEIEKELEILIEPYTRGDPESPLKWTCKSVFFLKKKEPRDSFKKHLL